MKNFKLTIIAITFLFIGITNPYAQEIEVTSSEVQISGVTRLDPAGSGHTDLILDNTGYYGGAALRPEANNASNIGTSTKAFKQVWAYDIVNLNSDKKQKENIREIDSALVKINKIKGIKFDLKKEYSIPEDADDKLKEKLEKDRKNKFGFVAQDLEKVVPEAVVYDEETDVYGINYMEMVPLLVEALKEQQEQIEELEKRLSKLDKK